MWHVKRFHHFRKAVQPYLLNSGVCVPSDATTAPSGTAVRSGWAGPQKGTPTSIRSDFTHSDPTGKSPRARMKEGSVVTSRTAKPAVIASELVCTAWGPLVCTAWEPCTQHAGESRRGSPRCRVPFCDIRTRMTGGRTVVISRGTKGSTAMCVTELTHTTDVVDVPW